MSNSNITKATDTSINAAEVKTILPNVVVDKTIDEVIAEATVAAEDKAEDRIGKKFNWQGAVATAAIAAIGSVADMALNNKLNKEHNPDSPELQYSLVEIVGVTLATAAIAGGIQSALSLTIDKVNDNENVNYVTMCAVANGTMIASSVARNKVLNLIKSQFDDIEAELETEVA
jgi:hypothetical protein